MYYNARFCPYEGKLPVLIHNNRSIFTQDYSGFQLQATGVLMNCSRENFMSISQEAIYTSKSDIFLLIFSFLKLGSFYDFNMDLEDSLETMIRKNGRPHLAYCST